MLKRFLLFLIGALPFLLSSQTGKTSPTLLKADKLFINMAYADAVELYVKHLKTNPKDYYTSRQAAICYTRLNDLNNAVDYWRDVVDQSAATPSDQLSYGKSLLANNRKQDAKLVFMNLKDNADPYLSAWGKLYVNPSELTEDSALTRLYELNGINTSKAEFSAVLYENELVYVTERKGSIFIKLSSAWANNNFYRLNRAQKNDSIRFSNVQVFNKYIQSKFYNGSLCFSSDGNTLYFTRSASGKLQKKQAPKNEGILKQQLFKTELNRFGDAHPEIKPFQYNAYTYNCLHPSLSKDGQYLYFSSDMPGGTGGYDIYRCTKDSSGWGKPINCGLEINTPGNEVFPFISEEGVLYFSSDYRPGMGGLDLFYAERWLYKDQLFFEAENLGANLNSSDDDFGIQVLDKGRTGYLSSNRKNKLRDDDIYYFVNNKPKSLPVKIKFVDTLNAKTISNTTFTLNALHFNVIAKLDSGFYFTRLKENRELSILCENENYKTKLIVKTITKADSVLIITLSPKAQNCVKGIIRDKDDTKPVAGLKVAVYDEDGNRYYDAITDSTGRYQVCNLPFGKDLYIGTEKKPDYFTNTERFKMPGQKQDVEKDIYALKLVVGKPIKIENIYFDLGKWNIRADAATELDKLVSLMKDNPDIVIELNSHTDCRGNANANFSLSDKRAKSSAAYLVSKGVPANRVKGKGYGESKLLNTCACEGKKTDACSEEQHAFNRRTEFKVTGFVTDKTIKSEKINKKSSKKISKKRKK